MNPYPPTHLHLRRAFDEGVRAAQRQADGRSHGYAHDTEEETLAWLNGFMQARMHRAKGEERSHARLPRTPAGPRPQHVRPHRREKRS